MMIKINQGLCLINGKPFKYNKDADEGERQILLKDVAVAALLRPMPNAKDVDKIRMYDLAKKISDCTTEEIDLTIQEISLIKTSVGIFNPYPLVVGQVNAMLPK